MAKTVIMTKDLDRGDALTGVARVEKIKKEEARRELQARDTEKELERAISAEVEKRMKAKSKRQKRGKKE